MRRMIMTVGVLAACAMAGARETDAVSLVCSWDAGEHPGASVQVVLDGVVQPGDCLLYEGSSDGKRMQRRLRIPVDGKGRKTAVVRFLSGGTERSERNVELVPQDGRQSEVEIVF